MRALSSQVSKRKFLNIYKDLGMWKTFCIFAVLNYK